MNAGCQQDDPKKNRHERIEITAERLTKSLSSGSSEHGVTRHFFITRKIDPPQGGGQDQSQYGCQDEAQIQFMDARADRNDRFTESDQQQQTVPLHKMAYLDIKTQPSTQ